MSLLDLDLDLDEAQLAQLPQHELAFLQWQMNWLATAYLHS